MNGTALTVPAGKAEADDDAAVGCVGSERRCAAAINQIFHGLVRAARSEAGDTRDMVATLLEQRPGNATGDHQIHADLKSIYGAGSETTAMSLTFFLLLMNAHPDVAERVYDEIGREVGSGPVRPEHGDRLVYLRTVLQEVVRLYPLGWMFPRAVLRDDQLGSARIPAGATVLISPYVTHRLEQFWERPGEFLPDRFAPLNNMGTRRHRYAYFPFGGGPHQCVGMHLFYTEAPLIIAALLSRFRPRIHNGGRIVAKPGASLRLWHRVQLVLDPRT